MREIRGNRNIIPCSSSVELSIKRSLTVYNVVRLLVLFSASQAGL
jgi:hypothetical protein